MTDLKSLARERCARAAEAAATWRKLASDAPTSSLRRSMLAALNGDWSDAKAERAASDRLAAAFTGDLYMGPHRFVIDPTQLRDISTASAASGGALQGSAVLGSMPARRGGSVIERLGARRLPAPATGTVARGIAPAASWLVDETTAITAADPVFGSASVRPYWVGARTSASRQLLFAPQSEAALADAIMASVGDAIDAAAFAGSGVGGQPAGITRWATSISGTSFNRAGARELERRILAAKGVRDPGAVAFVASAEVAETLGARAVTGGGDATVWTGSLAEGSINGVRAVGTANAPASTIIAGDWSQLAIYEFRPLIVEFTPYASATAFRTGSVEFRVLTAVDFVAEHPQAFCVASSVT
ncbi:MAG: phage major capsid protein [Pseudomonadota bacterium]